MTATLKEGVSATATYNRDGSGELRAWGDRFPRRWRVEGDDRVCLVISDDTRCFTIEFDRATDVYRGRDVANGETVVFNVDQRQLTVAATSSTNQGGASQPSAEEIAAKLANPNAPLASLTFRLQHRTYEGDLPDADDQSNTTLIFQPSFPFTRDNGDVIFFRPSIPIQFDSPVFDPAGPDFDSEAGLGDIAFDIAYGRTTDAGLLFAGGIVSSIPTATDDALGTDRWTLGPEFMIGKITKKYVIGAFPSHQWDIGGSGDADISLTTAQLFGTYLPGDGWNVGTSPILSYDHEASQWTIPINLTVGKTIIWNGRPWKLSLEVNYFVEQADAFGPRWFIGFNVAPVVENALASWFK